MPEVFYDSSLLPVEGDLVGIIETEKRMVGTISNARRSDMVFDNIDIYRNEDRTLRVFLRDGNSDIVDLTGAACVFTVKMSKSDVSSVFSLSTEVIEDGEIGSSGRGECFFYIKPSDTAGLDIGQYVFDVSVTLSNGKRYVTVEGVVNLLQSVG